MSNSRRSKRSLRPGPVTLSGRQSAKVASISRFATTAEEEKEVKQVTGGRLNRNILKRLNSMSKLLANPDKIPLKTYKTMYDTDETIQSGIEFISLSAISMLGEYSHPKPTIEKRVRKAINGLQEGWFQFWDELITDGCVYGFANAEICMDVNEDASETLLTALIGLNPLSGKYKLNLTEGSRKYGDIEAFVQWPETSYQVTIPAQKLVTWAHKSRHGNHYGTSRLKCFWKDWVIKDQMLKAWALAMERCGAPLTWIKTPDGSTKIENEDGLEQTRAEYLLDILENISEVSGFVIGENEDVGNHQVPRSVGSDFKIIVDHMNAMMFRGLLIPILLLDTGDVGSNALAEQHFQVYVMAMSKLMSQIIPTVIRTVIRRFIIANFGSQADDDYGSFSVKELAEDNLKLMSDIFYSMTQEGYMSPKLKTDMDFARKKLTIPPISEEDHKKLISDMEKAEEAAQKPAGNPLDPNSPSTKSQPKVGGRKGNPSGPSPQKPGTRPAAKPPSKKQGRPKE